MMKSPSERTLWAVLESDAEDISAADGSVSGQALPSLDERVELFLRAVHGSRPSYTPEQRSSARHQLLKSMAADLAVKPVADGLVSADQSISKIAATENPIGTANKFQSGLQTIGSPGALVESASRLLGFIFGIGHSRFAFASIITLAFVGSGWTAAWFYAAHTAQATIDGWIKSEAQAGRIYECDSRDVGGFPLRVQFDCLVPKATLLAGESKLVVTAEKLIATAQVFRPKSVASEVVGPLSITIPDRRVKLSANWASTQTRVSGDPTRIQHVWVLTKGLMIQRRAADTFEPVLNSERIEFRADLEPEKGGKPVFNIATEFRETRAPKLAPLGRPASGKFDAVLIGVGDRQLPLPQRLKAWQSAGGYLEVTEARLKLDDAVVTARGKIALNAAGRPDGALAISTTDFPLLAQALIGDDWRSQVSSRLAQSAAPQANTKPDDASSIDRERLAREQAERERALNQLSRRTSRAIAPEAGTARHQTQPNSTISSSPQAGATGPLRIPAVRFVNGTIYFGSVRLGEIPSLF
jgi:hypothetical protein